jgi:hypothetical protein
LTPAPAPTSPALVQCFADLAATVNQLDQVQDMLPLSADSGHGHAGFFATRVDLEYDFLNDTAYAIFQAKGERIHSHHHRAPASKQKPGSFFRARHQRFLLSV